MKVPINWLKELVELNISIDELINLLPLRSVSIKDVTDSSIELDMKGYNRADLLSLRGVAQEVAAITDSKLKFTDDEVKTEYDVSKAKVTVDNPKLVPVYCITKIENLRVEQSNDSWVKKLSDCGIRAINNVADVTNLIMMEYGQPMHAFDARGVKDEAIIVRTAKVGERITTLDGKTRDLETSDLLISDSLNALGIAGVMGGKDSEITDSTTTILLEAAIFDPVNIRKTATRLGLQSEASKRFQHGLTKRRLLQALNAAIKMYGDLGGKLTALTIAGDLTDQVKKVNLTQKKLNSLIGIEIKPEEVAMYLKKLGFSLASKGDALRAWEVTVPYWRLDIEIEEDLIEEVARMYGYEKIPAKELVGKIPPKIDQSLFKLITNLKSALVNQGLTEVQTYSFYSMSVLDNLEWDKNKLVRVANPISSETEYLREDLWPNLLEAVEKNIRQGIKDVAIFELGKVYSTGKNGPTESYRLSLTLCNGSDDPTPQLYQIFQSLALQTGFANVKLGSSKKGEYEKKYFHPIRLSFLEKDRKNIGGIAEIHPKFVNRFGMEKKVAVLEIEIDSLLHSE